MPVVLLIYYIVHGNSLVIVVWQPSHEIWDFIVMKGLYLKPFWGPRGVLWS